MFVQNKVKKKKSSSYVNFAFIEILIYPLYIRS